MVRYTLMPRPYHHTADCKCDCGNSYCVLASLLRNGKRFRCNECGEKDRLSKLDAHNRRPRVKKVNLERKFQIRLSQYRTYTKRIDREFTLTESEARVLVTSPCHYCGVAPNPYGGIDRVNSTMGYFAGNVVPCCSMCNFAKRHNSVEDFLAWVDRVHTHQNRGE